MSSVATCRAVAVFGEGGSAVDISVFASHRRVGNGFKGDAARRRTRFFDSASAPLKMTVGARAAYHSVQYDQVFARSFIAKNLRVRRVMVEKIEFLFPPLKSIGVFDTNLGD